MLFSKLMNRKRLVFDLFILLVVSFLVYLPFVFKTELLLARQNDLQEQFWPVFYYIRQHFWQDHSLPFWNNLFFSGTPLLPDPQFSLFYPANWIFILLPTNPAFFVWLIIHTFGGGLTFLLLTRGVFKFSRQVSVIAALLYIVSPRLGSYLAAGHYGLIGTLAWLPLVAFCCFKLVGTKKFGWSVLLGTSFASLFFLHTVTLIIAASSSFVLVLVLTLISKTDRLKTLLFFFISSTIAFGLTAVTLLPQLAWLPRTTRFLLLQDRDVYPKWNSPAEFIGSVFSPLLNLNTSPDTEKWLFLGVVPTTLALFAFIKLKKRVHKILILAAVLIAVFVSLNNASPVYNILLSQDWYVLFRVATRVWFVPIMIVLVLAGLALERIRSNKLLLYGISVLAIMESVFISLTAINKPVLQEQSRIVPGEVYTYLAQDTDKFRVFCTSRCISQKQAALNNLELVEGYNTLVQTNYFKHSWQLMGGYWNYYTLAVPPIGSYQFSNLQPDAKSLGEYNTKYVIADYDLADKSFVKRVTYGKYSIFENMLFLHRAYYQGGSNPQNMELKLLSYSPNMVRVDTSGHSSNNLVLAQVYSPGWTVYLDGVEPAVVQETPESLQKVTLKENTKYVEFIYEPPGFRNGLVITAGTIASILIWLIAKKF